MEAGDRDIKAGLHHSVKGATVFAGELSAAVESGMGSIKKLLIANIVFTRSAGSYLEVPQTVQEATSTYKPVTKCPQNIFEAGY